MITNEAPTHDHQWSTNLRTQTKCTLMIKNGDLLQSQRKLALIIINGVRTYDHKRSACL